MVLNLISLQPGMQGLPVGKKWRFKSNLNLFLTQCNRNRCFFKVENSNFENQ